MRTDVSDPASVEALADDVFEHDGACHLLFNNAGVTSGGGGLPWEQEPNDWRWCFGVNVFGVANGVLAFVPRMIESGEPGVVVNTSSGDGGIAPVPYASVYAAEQGGDQLLHRGARAPARHRRHEPARGGLLPVRRAAGHRPLDRATQPAAGAGPSEGPGARHRARRSPSSASSWPPRAGRPTSPTSLELGRFVVAGVKAGTFVIGHDLDQAGKLLHARADAIAEGHLPPNMMEFL